MHFGIFFAFAATKPMRFPSSVGATVDARELVVKMLAKVDGSGFVDMLEFGLKEQVGYESW